MANINISDLRHAGADLFLDSESYLNDLTEGEMTNTFGAFWCPCRWTSRFCVWVQVPGVQGSATERRYGYSSISIGSELYQLNC